MRTHRWMFLPVVLVMFPAIPAAGQDLTFIQAAADAAVDMIHSTHGHPLTVPRYIDATRLQSALGRARMPVPSVAELREALERDESDEPRIIVVEYGSEAIQRGPPDDPRLQAHIARTGWQPTADAPEELTWIAGDGVTIRPLLIVSHGADEYQVLYYVGLNSPGLLAGHAPKISQFVSGQRFVKRDGEWVTIPFGPIPIPHR